jgi:hypothetical protein
MISGPHVKTDSDEDISASFAAGIALYHFASLSIALASSNGYYQSTQPTEFIIDLGSYTAKALPRATTPRATSKPYEISSSMHIGPQSRLIRRGNWAEKEQRCIAAVPQTTECAAG